jgi:hypothetical protein
MEKLFSRLQTRINEKGYGGDGSFLHKVHKQLTLIKPGFPAVPMILQFTLNFRSKESSCE